MSPLERRYLRLLGCYPPGQREEMLGVLLATARPGQRLPDARQAVNLVTCGLAIRARRIPGRLATDPWQDALAVISLIAPALMLIVAVLDFGATLRQQVADHQGFVAAQHGLAAAVPFWQPWLVALLAGPAALIIAWLAVVVLGLTGRRRAAAAIASLLFVLALLILLVSVMQLSGAWFGGFPILLLGAGPVGPVVLASMAAGSLAFSAGPRRGLAIVGRPRACLMIAGLSAGFGFPAIAILLSPSASLAALAFGLAGVLTVAVAVVVTRVRSTVGWRVTVPVTTGLLLDLASTFSPTVSFTATVMLLLGSLLFAVLVWPAAIASWRGRVRQASRAG